MSEPGQKETKCRSCGAPILWAETEKGKNIPIDPTPVQDGNLVLILRKSGLPPITMFADRLDGKGLPRYKSHFATCPNAGSHRKKSGGPKNRSNPSTENRSNSD